MNYCVYAILILRFINVPHITKGALIYAMHYANIYFRHTLIENKVTFMTKKRNKIKYVKER